MAAPSVLSRTPFQGPASDAATATLITAADLSAGNFAVAFIASDGNPTLSVNTGSSTSGWQKVGQFSNTTLMTIGIFKKVSPTNSETLVIDSSANEQFVGFVYVINDANNISAASDLGASGTSNSPSLDIGSSQDVLWLSLRAPNAGNSLSGAGPSGYSNLNNQVGTSSANTSACIQIAEKQATGAQTEDPGAFGSATNPWLGVTVGIWKAASGVSLTIANASSASTVDNVTLAPKTILAINDASSASTAESPILAPRTALTVADASSASTVDSPTITPRTALTIANAASASAADNVALSVAGALGINSASSASTAGNVVLTPRTTLTVANAASASTVPNVTLAAKTLLAINNAASSSTAGNVTLNPRTPLVANDAVSLSQLDAITLASRYGLVIANAISPSVMGHVTLQLPGFPVVTPAGRRAGPAISQVGGRRAGPGTSLASGRTAAPAASLAAGRRA